MGRKDDFDDDFLDPDSDAYDYKPVSSSEGGLAKSAKIFIAVSVIAAGGVGTWLFMGDGSGDEQNIPVVRAENQAFKQKPSEPGGMDVPNRDKTVYNRLSGENTEPTLERLLPRPEKPLEMPLPSLDKGPEVANDPNTGLPVVVSEIPEVKAPAVPLEPVPMVNPEATSSEVVNENTREIEEVPSEELAEAIEPPTPPSLVAQSAIENANKENAPRALLTRDEKKVKEAVVEETKPTAVTVQDQDAMIAKIAEALAEEPAEEIQKPKQVAKAVQPKAPEVKPSSTSKSGFLLQVLSSKSESAVKKSMQQITSKHKTIIGNIPANVVRADLGPDKGVFYRLRLGPIADSNKAKSLCNELKNKKVGCFIVKVQ